MEEGREGGRDGKEENEEGWEGKSERQRSDRGQGEGREGWWKVKENVREEEGGRWKKGEEKKTGHKDIRYLASNSPTYRYHSSLHLKMTRLRHSSHHTCTVCHVWIM